MEDQNAAMSPDNRFTIVREIAIYNNGSDLVFANLFKRADDALYQNNSAMKANELAVRQNEESEIKNEVH